MATTETFQPRPLSDYAPSSVAVRTFHTWEATTRRGLPAERTYALDHASAACPAALAAEGIGQRTAQTDGAEGWPCPECFLDSPRADRLPNGGRQDSVDAPERSGAGGGASRSAEPASEPQVRLLTALVRAGVQRSSEEEVARGERACTPEEMEAMVASTVQAVAVSKRAAAKAIDAAKAGGLRPIWEPLAAAPEAAAAPAAAPQRTNRYAASCASCGAQVPAEAGELAKGPSGWEVRHVGACPAPASAPAPSDGYQPAKGDVHVLDGTYYRVHESQTSGYLYGAVWNGAKFVGPRHDERAKGLLRRISSATLATAEEAAAFGHMHHRCCFCSTPIDTPESEAVGYGPKCAADRGLPWGEA